MIGIAGLALFSSLIFGHVLLWFFLAVTGYLLWHLVNLVRFEKWIRGGLKGDLPESIGIWEENYLLLNRWRKHNDRYRQRLTQRLNRFQEVARALPDAIVVLNENDSIEWCNRVAMNYLGIHSSNDIGQPLINIVRHPQLVKYIAGKDESDPVLVPSPVNGNMILSVRLIDYGNDQHLLIARDVTHLQRIEKMRRDFVANVSHEMRSPLTVISGYLETLKGEHGESLQPWENIFGQMSEQAVRMQHLVEDLLLLAKLESNDYVAQRDKVNVPQLLSILLNEAKALSGDRHKIQLNVDETLWLEGNSTEIHSAFSNLVSNAIRYTPSDGNITINWFKDGNHACFSVEDSGVGIQSQHIPRLTERFYRVDVARSRHTGGTGLGLAIVKHILQRHGATLHIESEPDEGSLFRCDFPQDRITQYDMNN